MKLSKAERTAAITRSLSSGLRSPLASFDSRKYIQHNVNIGDGLEPILEFMDALPAKRTRSDVVRAFEDGDYSVVHADYDLGDWGAMVGFEVHRWENDRIVEHWDNLCSTPTAVNASGRSMTDGNSELADLGRTEKNRKLIWQFADDVLLGGALPSSSPFFLRDELLQHSVNCGDGVEAYRIQLQTLSTYQELRYQRIHKVLGQGNLFLVMSEGELEGNPTAFYDLYRLSGGHIVEHWDVIETIPPSSQWENSNGKF